MKTQIHKIKALLIALLVVANYSQAQTINWSENEKGCIDAVEGGNSIVSLGGTLSSFGNTFQKRDGSGNVIFAHTFPVAKIHGVTGNNNGDFVVYGQYQGTEDFDITAASFPLNSHNGTPDFFFAKYDLNGNLLLAEAISVPSGLFDLFEVTDLVLHDDDYMTGIGRFQGGVSFHSGEGTGSSSSSTHLAENPSVFFFYGNGNIGGQYYMEHVETSSGSGLSPAGFSRSSGGDMAIALHSDWGTLGGAFAYDSLKFNEVYDIHIEYVSHDFIFSLGSGYLIEINDNWDMVSQIDDISFDNAGYLHVIGTSNQGGNAILSSGLPATIPNQGLTDAFYGIIAPEILFTGTPSSTSVFSLIHTYGSPSTEEPSLQSFRHPQLVVRNGKAYVSRVFNDVVNFNPNGESPSQNLHGLLESTVHSFAVGDPYDPSSVTVESVFTIGGSQTDYITHFDFDSNNDFYVAVSNFSTNGAIDIDPSPVTNNVADYALIKYNGASSVLTGLIYADINDSGTMDAGEYPISNAIVEIDNGTYSFSVTTNEDGVYAAYVPLGNYTISCDFVTSGYYDASLPGSIIINAVTANTTYANNDFGLSLIPGMNDVAIVVNPITPVRPGFEAKYEVVVINMGTTTINPVATFTYDSQLNFVNAEGTPNQAGNTLTWTLSSMLPNSDTSFIVTLYATPFIGIGTLVAHLAEVDIANDQYLSDNSFGFNQITQGAYDPNDKQVFPASVSQQFVDDENYLNYLIRFQNTGTDTAFNVIVRDTLDMNLQYNTLNITSASHELTPTMYFDASSQRQIMEFKFADIMLVDSTMNEPGSHGYLSYRIKLDTGFTVGDVAYNTADIYFDYNAPVITNTTVTQINEIVSSANVTPSDCLGDCNGDAVLSVSGGSGNYSYAWQGLSIDSNTVANLCPGEYIVQISDDIGNATLDTVSIAGPSDPTVASISSECSVSASAPSVNDNCTGLITATTSDPTSYSTVGNYTITWTFDFGNGYIVDAPQSVTVTDNSAPDTPTLTSLSSECSVTAVAPTTIDNCAGTITGTTTDPLTYTTEGTYTINWTFDDGNGNSIVVPQSVIIDDMTDPSTPTLSALNDECSVSAVAPTTTDNCAGTITGTTTDALTYSVEGSYTINWTFDDGNGNSIVVPQSVVIDDMTEPSVPTLSALNEECSVTAVAPTTTDNCAGTITGTTTDPLTYSAEGSYTINWTFDDGNGNSIVVPQSITIEGIPTGMRVIDASTLMADASGYAYQWIDCNNGNTEVFGETNQTFTTSVAGSYAVIVSNGSCSDTSSCSPLTVGVDEENSFNLQLFPNPSSGIVQVTSDATIQQIVIRGVNGQVVYISNEHTENQTIDVAHIAPGVYQFEIKTSHGVTNKRFIKL